MRFLKAMASTLLSWGPPGVLLLAILDSAGVPIPGGVDALLVLMGSQDATMGYISATLAIVGSLAGSLFLFAVARKGGEAYLDKRTQTGRARRFRRWFDHYGGVSVFIPAVIPAPLPLKIFVIAAGALNMRRSHFIAIMLAARIPRYFGLAYLGAQLGARPLEYITSHKWHLLAVSAGLFLFSLLLVKVKDRLREAELRRTSRIG